MFPAASNATLLACAVEALIKVFFNDPSGLCHCTWPPTGSKASATKISPPVTLAVTVNELLLVAVPPGVVTLIVPVVAPLGTVAEIEVDEVTEKLTALVPLNVTAVAPVKLVPVIVTLVPTGPLVGVKLVIVGGLAVTVNELVLVAVPPGVLTLMGPVVAPLGTVA